MDMIYLISPSILLNTTESTSLITSSPLCIKNCTKNFFILFFFLFFFFSFPPVNISFFSLYGNVTQPVSNYYKKAITNTNTYTNGHTHANIYVHMTNIHIPLRKVFVDTIILLVWNLVSL